MKSPFYSEAEREFTPVQDFTINDVSVLVLCVRGKSTNAPATLFVGLEDASRHTALVACPDPKALTTAKWTQWQIPLTDFAGVNAAKVSRLYIRVGDKGASAPGGSGQLYVDDIRVIKVAPAGQ